MLKPEHERRRGNLSLQLEKSGLNRAEFAKRLEVTPSYLSQLLQKGFRFGEKAARAMEQKLNIPVGSLDDSLEKTLYTVALWEKPDDLPDGVYALVQRIPVTPQTGTAAKGGEVETPPLAFRKDWLQKKNVSSSHNLRVCLIEDDSMEGYLQEGDSVLIDMGQKEIVDNQVYALEYGGSIKVKRLSRRFDGGLFLRSDNPDYPEEVVRNDEIGMIKVIGKQIWRGG